MHLMKKTTFSQFKYLLTIVGMFVLLGVFSALAEPIEIKALTRTSPVDFQKEIFP